MTIDFNIVSLQDFSDDLDYLEDYLSALRGCGVDQDIESMLQIIKGIRGKKGLLGRTLG